MKVTKMVEIRFIGHEGIVDFAIECLKEQLKDNISCRRQEEENIKTIEAKIIDIKRGDNINENVLD